MLIIVNYENLFTFAVHQLLRFLYCAAQDNTRDQSKHSETL